MGNDDKVRFRRSDVDNRQISELIGYTRGILADKTVNQSEVISLLKWLVANKETTKNPVIGQLQDGLDKILRCNNNIDIRLDEVRELLEKFASNDFEIGEVLKATSLPLCEPVPVITFQAKRFCFTGNFVFGNRRACEEVVAEFGGVSGNLTQKTNFLVVGEYATDSWIQSSYGRKIEKAVTFRKKGLPISIVSEKNWFNAISQFA